MTQITEDLIRKRAEHNNCEISTLEEVSLHQQDIVRIEHIERWCRDLKILYLQSNLIPKIENVGKLKKLEYLNLALNNIERVENLEACESLKKLDLTVNFVGELTSIECLRNLYQFEELSFSSNFIYRFLTGNPCTEYEGYRDYIIAALPNIRRLDGIAVEKSERISAVQNYPALKQKIISQQEKYRRKREDEKEESVKKKEGKEEKEKKPGFDGRWYTDINSQDSSHKDKKHDEQEKDDKNFEEQDAEFWKEKVAFTPESRLEVHDQLQKQKKRGEKQDQEKPKKERRLFADDGHPLNVNEAKIDFTLTDDDDANAFLLDIPVYKHLDTSLLDVDVQTTHVKVVIKGKTFQLVLPEEINPDCSNAKRSQITGHLLITMPKVKLVIKAQKPKEIMKEEKPKERSERPRYTQEKLEVDPTKTSKLDYGNIVSEKKAIPPLGHQFKKKPLKERPNSEGFVDDPDVPPLI